MKKWFEYPDSIYERRKVAEAVARVYRAVDIPADGKLFTECFKNDRHLPVYALLENSIEIAEFLRVVGSCESSLNYDHGRGERLEAAVRGHLRNCKCLAQIWCASDADRRVCDLSQAVIDFMPDSGDYSDYGERRLGDGIVACRADVAPDTVAVSRRAIHLYWFTEDTAFDRVSDEEALAALDGID